MTINRLFVSRGICLMIKLLTVVVIWSSLYVETTVKYGSVVLLIHI